MVNINNYNIGDVVSLKDKICPDILSHATIKYIEPDDENDQLFWLYLVANDSILNDKYDSRFNTLYWEIVASTDPDLELICKAC